MLLAEKFGMEYVDADGQKKRPYIIHRTSLGCYERTLAYLIERFAGALPMWMSPEQARIMTITNRADDFAYELKARLEKEGIRVTVDDRNEKIGFKIREAQNQKVPYMLVLGDQEVENKTAALRSRKNENFGAMSIEEIIAKFREEIDTKAR